MPPFDHLRRFGREAVERVRGQGENVHFRHRAETFARDHRVPLEQAQKEVWTHDLRAFEAELRLRGQLQPEGWERLNAGLGEMFDEADIEQFRVDGEDPAIVRPLRAPVPTARDVRRLEQRYQQQHGEQYEQAPLSGLELDEIAQHLLMMRELSRRVLGDAAHHPDSLQAMIGVHPEIGADLGQLLVRYEAIHQHERRMERRGEARAAVAEGRQALGNMLFEPVRWFLDTNVQVFRMIRTRNPIHFFHAVERTVTMMGREIGAASHLVRGMVRLLRSIRH